MQSKNRVLTIDCQFECSSLVWTSLLLSGPSAAEGHADPKPEKDLLEFCQGLLQVAGVHSSDKPKTPQGLQEGHRQSFWCKAWAFPLVLQAAMLFSAGGTPGNANS